MSNINENVLSLINELVELNTFQRMNTYGIFKTLRLSLSRWYNPEVVKFFNDYLNLLESTQVEFNKTPYKVFFNKTILGELYNLSRVSTESPNSKDGTFFYKSFDILSELTIEILKSGIDNIYDEEQDILNTGSNFRTLSTMKSNTSLGMLTKQVANEFTNLVMDNELGQLVDLRNQGEFTRAVLNKMNSAITFYLRTKYSQVVKHD